MKVLTRHRSELSHSDQSLGQGFLNSKMKDGIATVVGKYIKKARREKNLGDGQRRG